MKQKHFVIAAAITGIIVLGVALRMIYHYKQQLTTQKEVLAQLKQQQEHYQDSLRTLNRLLEADSLFINQAYDEAFSIYKSLGLDTNFINRRQHRYTISLQRQEAVEKVNNVQNTLDEEKRKYEQAFITQVARLQELQNQRNNASEQLDSLEAALRVQQSSFERALQQQAEQMQKQYSENYGLLQFTTPRGNKVYYLGETKDGVASGKGVGIWDTGSIYEGQWKNNMRHGKGLFRWKDGERYEGEYFQDKRQGLGTYHWTNGSQYTGEWVNDKRHGNGKFTDASKTVYDGDWKDDKFVGNNGGSSNYRVKPANNWR
ncbi:hypothetical protein [Eisenibacter elegans]|jgi:hypothetical protein|uniref:hypothetical protein n=1 Tax=Eisenibacter elegans TaxID=997 RepID=UPI0003F4F0A3|nr:hypothetical protein [Eisenibacter elegans]